MSLPKDLMTRLGLAETADDAAIAAAIGAALDRAETHASTMAALAAAAGAPAGTAGDGLVTHLQAIAAKAAGSGEAGTMRATIVELQGRLDREVAARTRERAAQVIDAAIAAGKPVKALRDHYIERHMREPEAVETELAALVSVHSGGIDPARRAKPAACTSDDPREIQRAAEAHQKTHGGAYEDAVLIVTGRA